MKRKNALDAVSQTGSGRVDPGSGQVGPSQMLWPLTPRGPGQMTKILARPWPFWGRAGSTLGPTRPSPTLGQCSRLNNGWAAVGNLSQGHALGAACCKQLLRIDNRGLNNQSARSKMTHAKRRSWEIYARRASFSTALIG
jgi:hypothetical protein